MNHLKRGAWIVCRFKSGLGKKEKRKDDVFEVGGYGKVETPMHTMNWRSFLIDTNIQSKKHCNTVLLLIILTIIDT